MSSKRDLVEAHSFNRRRLVTAFTSGAPGGREVEAPRHGRTIVGGAVLAALIVAAAAVAGLLKPTVPDGWNESGMVIGKESGARFVAQNGTLYSVINTTSARLLTEPGEFKVRFVPDDKIAAERPGATVGIVGAPDVLPTPAALIQTGWTACANGSGMSQVRIAEKPAAAPVSGAAVAVRADDKLWVVSEGARYEVAPKDGDTVFAVLGIAESDIRTVPANWVALFPEGTPLAPFALDGQGNKIPGAPAEADKIGELLRVDDQWYVAVKGGIAPVSDIEQGMIAAYRKALPVRDTPVPTSILNSVDSVEAPFNTDWPTTKPAPLADDTICALVTHDRPGALATVSLAVPPKNAAPLTDDARKIDVADGHGALVLATDGAVNDRGTAYLIDATGRAYKLAAQEIPVAELLGYGKVTMARIPASWISVFGAGRELSSFAAGQPVRSAG
jgi:type VII secretion protein EccB